MAAQRRKPRICTAQVVPEGIMLGEPERERQIPCVVSLTCGILRKKWHPQTLSRQWWPSRRWGVARGWGEVGERLRKFGGNKVEEPTEPLLTSLTTEAAEPLVTLLAPRAANVGGAGHVD